jgi:molecular chaperone GrpE
LIFAGDNLISVAKTHIRASMSNSNDHRPDAQDGASPADTPEAAPAPEEQVRVLAAAVDELRDKFLRAVAETDNVRKRAERDVADARTYGITGFARDVVAVADNLARALGAVSPEQRAAADETLKALLDGVDLTRRELQNTLKKHGVRELDPKGEKFDPNFHQAMYEVPDPQVPAGTVVQVVQTGYAIGERVLRPAMVAVSKGGAKAASAPEPAAG